MLGTSLQHAITQPRRDKMMALEPQADEQMHELRQTSCSTTGLESVVEDIDEHFAEEPEPSLQDTAPRQATPARMAALTNVVGTATTTGHRQPLSKAEQREKKELLEQWTQLKGKALVLEREVAAIKTKASLREMIAEVMGSDETVWEHDAATELKSLQTGLLGLKGNVDRLLHLVKNPRGGHTYIEMLKEMMEGIEADVLVFKSNHRENYEALLDEERILTHEIRLAEERIHNWDAVVEVAPVPLSLPSGPGGLVGDEIHSSSNQAAAGDLHAGPQVGSTGLLPEVIEFQDYLARHGGHYGGWDDLSHLAFVKYRLKFGTRDPKFMQHCLQFIPNTSEQGILVHDEWFRGYTRRLDAKKRAIELWRERKRAAVRRIEESLDELTDATKKANQAAAVHDAQSRQEQRQAVQQWREEREKLKMEQEWEQERQRREQQKRETQRRAHHTKIKQVVSVYIQQRTEEDELKRRWEQEMRSARQNDAKEGRELRERFLQRDAQAVQRKMDLSKRKQLEVEARQKAMEKLKAHVYVDRDPCRLYQPTAVLMNRISAKEEMDLGVKAASKFSVNSMPRRSVPAWRAGID
ncbi:hypothetical protein BC831DRAFT_3547 [Entophlyctis helioformis]|nr:hypothetical protein BC831DRAFT_3547 [Entophlyctis helioformis]